jgi:hypothetical protein
VKKVLLIALLVVGVAVGAFLVFVDPHAGSEPPAPIYAPAAAPTAPSAPEPPPIVPDAPRAAVDLGGARAELPPLGDWKPLADGAYARPATPGSFLTETLVLAPTCLGACAELDATITHLDRWWMENRVAYSLRFTRRPGRVQHPRPDVTTLKVQLKGDSPETSARVFVEVVRPRGAARALLCEILVFGDDAALDRAASVCRDVRMVAAP